jgi:hypothetical protein
LKTQPKPVLGSLPLALALPAFTFALCNFKGSLQKFCFHLNLFKISDLAMAKVKKINIAVT